MGLQVVQHVTNLLKDTVKQCTPT